jgi:hypothetical protein
MCTGIAITLSEVPAPLVEEMPERLYTRAGKQELQFHWWKTPTVLPVRWDGSLQLLQWGCKSRRSPLPYGGWIDREQLEAGLIAPARPEEVVISANLGFHKGTWFLVDEGICGVVLPDVPGGPVVYMLTAPASNYYRNMTGQSATMPVFVNQII